MSMKKLILFFLAVVMMAGHSEAQNKKQKAVEKDTHEWKYEVETVSKNGHGDYILKVWSFSKDAVVAAEQGKKNAVHSIVFKGTPASQNNRIPGIKALVPDFKTQQEYGDFFDRFFADGGDYMRFVTVSNNGFADIVKIPKVKNNGEKSAAVYKFKVGLTVTINVPALRKYLEDAGVVRALGAGFN